MNIDQQDRLIFEKWLANSSIKKEFLAVTAAKEGFKKRALLALFEHTLVVLYINQNVDKEVSVNLGENLVIKFSFGVLNLRFVNSAKKTTNFAFIPVSDNFMEFTASLENQIKKVKAEEFERKSEEQEALALKRGQFLGSFEPESGLQKHERGSSKYGDRKLLDLFVSNGQKINVYSKMIECAGAYYDIDKYVTADVISDGQIQVSRRPTLTRMGALAFLPGTALIPGMALAKKTTHDTREVVVSIAHPNWNLTVNIRPMALGPAKTLAMRINAIADSMKEEAVQISPMEQMKHSDATMSTVDQLKEIKNLLDSGFISESEAADLKNKILGQ